MLLNRLFILFFTMVGLWMLSPIHVLSQPLTLPTGSTALLDTSLSLEGRVGYWVPERSIDFDASQLEQAAFQPLTDLETLFDGQGRPEQLWLRLQLSGEEVSSKETWLISWNAFEVVMFFPKEEGWDSMKSGVFVPMDERPLPRSYGAIPFFPIQVRSHEKMTLYFKVLPGQIRVHDRLEWSHGKIMTPLHYLDYDQKKRLLDILALGMFLAIAVYNLVIYFHTWSREYLLLSFFSLTLFAFFMILEDYSLVLFWPGYPVWNYTGFQMTTGLCVFSSFIIFTQKFLGFKLFVPGWNRLLNIMILLNAAWVAVRLVAEVVDPVWHAQNHPILAAFTRNYWVLMVIATVAAAIKCYPHRPRSVGRYLVINVVLVVAAMLRLLYVNEVINIPITQDYLIFIAAIQQVSFALSLGDQIRSTNRERENAENEVRQQQEQAEKLAAIDQAKTRLYANLTHEFRTPLTVIQGLSDNLQNEEEPVRLKEKLGYIQRSGQQLLTLVNQMLDLAKAESGELSLKVVQGDLPQYLSFVTESFQALAEEKSIRLQYVADPNRLVMDYDPTRMQQVLTNLVHNALKFTSAEGRVDVMFKQVGDREVEIVVADTGEGIAAKHLGQIFNRFFQIASKNQPGGGTGIGLSLVKELVELMKGRISVESDLGKGTTFRVRLPISHEAPVTNVPVTTGSVTQSKALEAESQVFSETGGESYSILVVEDNKDVRFYIKDCLIAEYRVLEAKNGVEGLNMARESVPDLIITDLMMPEMNGHELIQQLAADPRTNHIPIMVLSAKTDEETRLETYREGAFAYLRKPFEREELLLRLHQMLDLRSRMQQRFGGMNGGISVEKSEDPQVAFMYELKQHIMENIGEEGFHTEQLGRLMGMSRTQLNRKVKQILGETPGSLLRRMRIEEARRVLLNSDLQIAEVAYKVGFIDPAHFTRVFRAQVGVTPSELREKSIKS